MSSARVVNPNNFRVQDPIQNLTQQVEQLELTVSNTRPSGRVYFPDFSKLVDFRIAELVKTAPAFDGCYLMQHWSTSSQATGPSFTIPKGGSVSFSMSTSPNLDVLGPNINGGNWNTVLYTSTESPYISAFVLLTCQWVQDGNIVQFILNQADLDQHSNVLTAIFQPVAAGQNKETTITTVVPSGINLKSSGAQLGVVVVFYNSDEHFAHDITVWGGGGFNANTRSRIETTIIPQAAPPALTWVYDNSETILPGSFSAYDFYGPTPGTIPMDQLYGKTLVLDTSSIYGTQWYNLFENNSDFNNSNSVNVVDVYEPQNSIKAIINGWGVEGNEPNRDTQYRGFNWVAKTTSGLYFPFLGDYITSINRMCIFSLTGGFGSGVNNYMYMYQDSDTSGDYWQVNQDGDAASDTFCYTSVYTQGITPLTFDQLNAYFRAFVDLCIYNGASDVPSVGTMQSNFNANFAGLKGSLPANSCVSNFQLLTWIDVAVVGGFGTDFRVNIGAGRTYNQCSEPFYDPISNAGVNYHVGDVCYIDGATLGGVSGVNDARLTITSVDNNGAVLAYTISGNAQYLQGQNHIEDGGHNQYNNGNYLYSNNLAASLTYGNGSVQLGQYNGPSETIIDYNDSIFVSFNTNMGDNWSFEIDGTCGVEGRGSDQMLNLEQILYINLQEGEDVSVNGVISPGRMYNITIDSVAGDLLSMTGALGATSVRANHPLASVRNIDPINRATPRARQAKHNKGVLSGKAFRNLVQNNKALRRMADKQRAMNVSEQCSSCVEGPTMTLEEAMRVLNEKAKMQFDSKPRPNPQIVVPQYVGGNGRRR